MSCSEVRLKGEGGRAWEVFAQSIPCCRFFLQVVKGEGGSRDVTREEGIQRQEFITQFLKLKLYRIEIMEKGGREEMRRKPLVGGSGLRPSVPLISKKAWKPILNKLQPVTTRVHGRIGKKSSSGKRQREEKSSRDQTVWKERRRGGG